MRAVGDSALLVRDGEVALVDARGRVRRWFARDAAAFVSLENPARLAILSRSNRCIELIDVATGAVQRSFDVGARGLLGFTRDGARVLIDTADGTSRCALVDENGGRREVSARHTGYEHTTNDVTFAKSGDYAFLSTRDRPGAGSVRRIDLTNALVDWQRNHDLARIVVDDDGRRVLALERPSGTRAEALLFVDVVDGKSGWITRHTDGAEIASLWASRDLSRIAYVDEPPGAFVVIRWSPAEWKFEPRRVHRQWDEILAVDADNERVLFRSRDDVVLASFGFDVIGRAHATAQASVCFSARTAFVLDRGRVVALTASGVVALEGPTNIEQIVAHDRGVLAVDDEDRAHVLAIDDDVRGRSGEVSS